MSQAINVYGGNQRLLANARTECRRPEAVRAGSRALVVALLLAICSGATEAKTVNAFIQTGLREFSDIFLGQFTFDKAGGKILVKTLANVRGQRFLFFDGSAESWPTVLATYQSLSCDSLRNISLVVMDSGSPQWMAVSQDTSSTKAISEGLAIPVGKYQADLQLAPTPEPAPWFTMLSNCDDAIDIDFSIAFLNPGGWWWEHFSVDEQGLLPMFVGWSLVYTVATVSLASFLLRSAAAELHPFMVLVTAALLLECFGIYLQTWHGWVYASNGEGLVIAQALGEVMDAASNVVMMVLLFLLARGWTVTSASGLRAHFSRDWVISMAFFSAGFLSLFILERMGRAIDSRYCYDSDIGLLALVIRNAGFIYFCLALSRTLRREESEPRRGFLLGFGAAAGIWFLGLPVAYTASQFVNAWDQMKLVVAAGIAIHTSGLLLLMALVWPDLWTHKYLVLQAAAQASDQHGLAADTATPYDEI